MRVLRFGAMHGYGSMAIPVVYELVLEKLIKSAALVSHFCSRA